MSYLKTIEDTKKIDGVTLEDLSKENIYEIKIIYNISKMNKKDIEDYGFDLDRKSTYILYEKERYTCE